MSDGELAHYGVKGMKWGKRTASGGKFTRGNAPGKGESKDHQRVTKLRKKKVSQMSNEELKLLTARLQLEQSYSQLNPTAVERGVKSVKAVTDTVKLVNTVVTIGNSPVGKAGAKLIKAALERAREASRS